MAKTPTKKTTTSTTRSRASRSSSRERQAHLIDELYPLLIERSTRGRQARRKGGEYERTTAEALRVLWRTAKRSIGQARQGHEVPDVEGTPLWVECSKGSSTAILLKLRQALAARDEHLRSKRRKGAFYPVAVFARSELQRIDTVTMTRDEFIELLRAAITIAENFT